MGRPRPHDVAALAVGLLMFSLAGGACAARQASSLNHTAPTAKPASAPTTPSLEASDPRLAAALAALRPKATAATLRRVADEYVRLEVFDRAIAYLTRAIAVAPADGSLFAARARAYRDWGQPDVGLGDARRGVFLAPESADAENTLGTIQFAMNLLTDATTSFERALALAPGAGWALNNLCYTALIAGDEATAVARCTAALREDPSSATTRNNLALTYASAGRLDEARATFLGSGDARTALYNTGIVLMARRDYAAAAGVFSEACRATPSLESACRRAAEARSLLARDPARGAR